MTSRCCNGPTRAAPLSNAHQPTATKQGAPMNITSAPRAWRRVVALLLAITMIAAACGSDDGDSDASSDTSSTDTTTAAPAGDDTSDETPSDDADGVLAGVCPDTVVIQADWEPESEHGPLYQLVGDGYEIDTDNKVVTGPLVSAGVDTGVDIEVRIGGAAIGFTPLPTLMYTDTDILLGMTRLTEAMAAYEDAPTTGVMAMFEKSPIAFYWDPETYPEAESVADLKDDDVTIYMGRPDVFIDWMIAEGIVSESQVDLSDAPKPATFIAAGGEVAELGFVTAEPFLYEFEVPEWGRPVRAELLHDLGFPEYFQALSVRESDVTEQADCLALLMPMLQQSTIDYYSDPAPVNEFIVELVTAYETGWVYTLPAAEYSAAEQVELGIVGNGGNDMVGDFDDARIGDLIDIIAAVGEPGVADLEPTVLASNEFLDPAIGF